MRSGPGHHRWKGGRTLTSHGYVLVRQPVHPRAFSNGYVYEHIIVAEEALGRMLGHGEIVHHRNGDKADNRPENLEVLASIRHHRAQHRFKHDGRQRRLPDQPNPIVSCACGCGETFHQFDESGRARRYVFGHSLHPVP